MESGQASVQQIVTALRKMGADYVFDATFSADLTIMEEGTELLHRLRAGKLSEMPMFTSCCPGWVRFLKSQYPDMAEQLSTAKSPQQMFGATAKTWLAYRLGVDAKKVYSISIMPCTAKKSECELPDMDAAGVGPDVDLVLTTRELARMIRAEQLDPSTLAESPFDEPLGDGSGAGVIFGATGGVMEAALGIFSCEWQKPVRRCLPRSPHTHTGARKLEGSIVRPWNRNDSLRGCQRAW